MNNLLDVFGILGVVFALAFLAESMVEYLLGTPMVKLGADKYKWALMYVAALVGVGLAFWYKLDLIALLGEFLGEPIEPSWVGYLLTGAGIGRGSNFVHQFVSENFKGKP